MTNTINTSTLEDKIFDYGIAVITIITVVFMLSKINIAEQSTQEPVTTTVISTPVVSTPVISIDTDKYMEKQKENEKYLDKIIHEDILSDISFLDNKAQTIFKKESSGMDTITAMNLADFAYTLWCEDRHSIRAMYYVASVIGNRVASKHYPNTINKVIHQRKQFSCWTGGGYTPITTVNRDYKMWGAALQTAKKYMDGKGKRMTIATHYYAANKVNPKWANCKHSEKLIKVGHHVFLVTP